MVDYTESFLEQIVGISFPSGFHILFDAGFLTGASPLGSVNVNVLGGTDEVGVVAFSPPIPSSLPVILSFPQPTLNVTLSRVIPQSDFTDSQGHIANPLVIPFQISALAAHPVNGVPFLDGFMSCYVFFGAPKITVPTDLAIGELPNVVGADNFSFGNVIGGNHHFSTDQPSVIITPKVTITFGKKTAQVVWSL